MTFLRNFGAFWYDFIIGEDWRIAAAVVAALALTALLAHGGLDAWWIVPLVVVACLGLSVRAATRAS